MVCVLRCVVLCVLPLLVLAGGSNKRYAVKELASCDLGGVCDIQVNQIAQTSGKPSSTGGLEGFQCLKEQKCSQAVSGTVSNEQYGKITLVAAFYDTPYSIKVFAQLETTLGVSLPPYLLMERTFTDVNNQLAKLVQRSYCVDANTLIKALSNQVFGSLVTGITSMFTSALPAWAQIGSLFGTNEVCLRVHFNKHIAKSKKIQYQLQFYLDTKIQVNLPSSTQLPCSGCGITALNCEKKKGGMYKCDSVGNWQCDSCQIGLNKNCFKCQDCVECELGRCRTCMKCKFADTKDSSCSYVEAANALWGNAGGRYSMFGPWTVAIPDKWFKDAVTAAVAKLH